MEQKLLDLTDNLKAISDDARTSFGHLSGEQLNWKQGEESWSVAQCVDHIILTNEMFFDEMDKLGAGRRKNSLFENYSPFSGMFGRFLIKTVSTDSKKAKAPSKKIVPPSELASDIIDRYEAHQDILIGKVQLTGNADWERTIVTSPFLAVFTYSLADAYIVLVEHSKRHIRQAKRVMEAHTFPPA